MFSSLLVPTEQKCFLGLECDLFHKAFELLTGIVLPNLLTDLTNIFRSGRTPGYNWCIYLILFNSPSGGVHVMAECCRFHIKLIRTTTKDQSLFQSPQLTIKQATTQWFP